MKKCDTSYCFEVFIACDEMAHMKARPGDLQIYKKSRDIICNILPPVGVRKYCNKLHLLSIQYTLGPASHVQQSTHPMFSSYTTHEKQAQTKDDD